MTYNNFTSKFWPILCGKIKTAHLPKSNGICHKERENKILKGDINWLIKVLQPSQNGHIRVIVSHQIN